MENLTKLNIILNNYIGMEQEDVEECLEEQLTDIENIIDISEKERVFVSTNFQIRLEYENLDPLDEFNTHNVLKKIEIEVI